MKKHQPAHIDTSLLKTEHNALQCNFIDDACHIRIELVVVEEYRMCKEFRQSVKHEMRSQPLFDLRGNGLPEIFGIREPKAIFTRGYY